jgi:hypothetical protein
VLPPHEGPEPRQLGVLAVCTVRGLYRAFPPLDPPVYVRPQLKPSHAYARSPRRHLAPTMGQIKALVGVHPDGIFFICSGARHQHRLRAPQVFFSFPG